MSRLCFPRSDHITQFSLGLSGKEIPKPKMSENVRIVVALCTSAVAVSQYLSKTEHKEADGLERHKINMSNTKPATQ